MVIRSCFCDLDNPPVGTLVTCEDGHRICEIVGPIADWDKNTTLPAGLGHYTHGQHIAVTGDAAFECICTICGAPWVDDRPGIYPDGSIKMTAKIHLEDGWWP